MLEKMSIRRIPMLNRDDETCLPSRQAILTKVGYAKHAIVSAIVGILFNQPLPNGFNINNLLLNDIASALVGGQNQAGF